MVYATSGVFFTEVKQVGRGQVQDDSDVLEFDFFFFVTEIE